LDRMLARGADVNLVLRQAISGGDMDLLELAIKHNASPNLLMEEERGSTCLHWAVGCWESDQDSVIVRRLLEAGADPRTKNKSGQTALQYSQNPARTTEEIRIAMRSVFGEFGHSLEPSRPDYFQATQSLCESNLPDQSLLFRRS
jgi:hypothetical protein